MTKIKDGIKVLLIRSGITMTRLNELLNEKYGRNDTVQNLNNKLTKETIRYIEMLEIAETLGYKIEWVKKTPLDDTNVDNLLE